MDKKKARVLNVLVAGHAQHGKSSLIEAIVGKFPDNIPFELNHGTTVSLKVIQFQLKKQNLLLNFLDSPGHADFKGGIALGLEFADLLVLVISGTDGFQARTYWLLEKAIEMKLPMIIAATKMDLPGSNLTKIEQEIQKLHQKRIPMIKTSAKKMIGIEELVEKLSIYVKPRSEIDSDLSFIILGFDKKKGLGELLNIGILAGKLITNQFITDEVKIRHILALNKSQLKEAVQGEIIQIGLNVNATLSLGTVYKQGKLLSPKIEGHLSEIHPRKEFTITIDPKKMDVAVKILDNIKKILPSFEYYYEKNEISILVLGDLQFEVLRERLEDLLEFEVTGSKIKGVITINSPSKGNFKSASVRIVPRCKKSLTISRDGKEEKTLYDIIGASAAYEAFRLDGLHVDIISGRNEDDIAQAIAKAIEKTKIKR